MRNPIQPSPSRPIPLPDCILMDGWWADRRDPADERHAAVLRLVSVNGREDRDAGRERRERAD